MRKILILIGLFWVNLAVADTAKYPPLRVAVIGGMTMSGMWQDVSKAFEEAYNIPVEVVVSGPKHELDAYSRAHKIDLITMHSSDTIVDLAADGIVENLTPWARNSQMLVSHMSNPAHIDANDSLKEAMQKISQTNSPILIHASGGTFEVFNDVSSFYKLSPGQIHLITAKQGFLNDVAKLKGYTFFGVIPFLMQKQYHPDMHGFVFDDAKLRRPYLAAIGTKENIGKLQHQNAQKLLLFLTSKRVQNLIKNFRLNGFDKIPVFFPVKP